MSVADVARGVPRAASVSSALRAIAMLVAALALTLPAGCTTAPLTLRSIVAESAVADAPVAKLAVTPQNLSELQAYLLGHEANADLFRARGPFQVALHDDSELPLSASERIKADVFLSSATGKAPLVVFVHGHDSSKRAHANQAAHLASWGMHCISVQLPNQGPWDANGRILARLASLVQRSPDAIDSRVDTSRIILVGHSFGAYAVTVALSAGAPAAGAILLDPAVVGKDAPNFLRRIQKPVLVLGADDEISQARNREYFYELIRSHVAELSIRDAAHEDAQYPSDLALENGGVDPHTTEALQITFTAAITAAALSLASTGTFEYAWASYRPLFQDGRFFDAKQK